jgi:mRNA-degrading endonuclease RelE of RelBE toxin-antitoxin system
MNRALKLHREARKQMSNMIPKHYKQVHEKIFSLLSEPRPQDSRHMAGHPNFFRVTQGEYRVIYAYSDSEICVAKIGLRGDDDVYNAFDRQQG